MFKDKWLEIYLKKLEIFRKPVVEYPSSGCIETTGLYFIYDKCAFHILCRLQKSLQQLQQGFP